MRAMKRTVREPTLMPKGIILEVVGLALVLVFVYLATIVMHATVWRYERRG